MSSGLDASGSSSMGDIFQSFQNGGSNWGKRFEKQGARSVGRLTINGLGPDVTSAMVRAFLEPFYNTVQEVRLIPGRGGGMGGASVSFGFAAERDKAANELNGRELHGCRISVTKQADPVEPSAPQNRKRPLEEEIHDLLRQYQVKSFPHPNPRPEPNPHHHHPRRRLHHQHVQRFFVDFQQF